MIDVKYPDLFFYSTPSRNNFMDVVNDGCDLIRHRYKEVGINKKDVGNILTQYIKDCKNCVDAKGNLEEDVLKKYFCVIETDKLLGIK